MGSHSKDIKGSDGRDVWGWVVGMEGRMMIEMKGE